MITMHPGEYLTLSYVEPNKFSPAALAEGLGLPLQDVEHLLAKEMDLTAEMAVRLELAFDRSASSWMAMQVQHSLALAREKIDPASIQRFALVPRADAA